MKLAHSWSSVLGGVVVLLLVLPCRSISRLKSPANMMVYLGYFSMIFWIWFWISGIRCSSSKCDGIYIFRMISGVSGLLLIIMACR